MGFHSPQMFRLQWKCTIIEADVATAWEGGHMNQRKLDHQPAEPSYRRTWIQCADFPLYDVSDLGELRNRVTGERHNGWLDSKGYRAVRLRKNGKSKSIRLHILVARAFLGPRPASKEANHKDGVKTNNNRGNLEYISHLENMRHCFSHGLRKIHWTQILSWKDVLDMRTKFSDGHSYSSIAASYGMSYSATWQAVNGITWKGEPKI